MHPENSFNGPDCCPHSLPTHLMEISAGQWAFWRWICLRGSGFPSGLVQGLAAPEASSSADQLLCAAKAIENEQVCAISAFRKAVNDAAGQEERKQLLRSLKQLQKGRVPEFAEGLLREIKQRLIDLYSHAEALQQKFIKDFQAGVLEVSQRLRKTALDPHFRQALLLQNREAIRRVIHSFQQSKRGFKERQNEELIASYLQRYCLKNDTIGFFGPVGWARFSSACENINVCPGAALIANSDIYFENWGIESLADKFAENQALRPWMRPRILPFFHIENNRLYSAGNPSSSLPPAYQAVLKRCNGEHTAREIAQYVMSMPGVSIKSESQVNHLLEVFVARGIISWRFEIPLCRHPEQYLCHLLQCIEDQELRQPLIEALDQLNESREAVARAFGDAEKLSAALEELDAVFSRLTGKSPTKSAGSMYAARTLIYQDCRRDAEVNFGREVAAFLGAPLSLLLASARWFSYESVALYRQECEKIHEELLKKNNGQTVEMIQFWSRVEPLVFDHSQRLFNPVQEKFQSIWEEILNIPSGEQRVEYCSEGLLPLVKKQFAAPRAGWRLARYHSPDVMIAASSPEAIQRGDYFFVLGEVHITTNTQRFSFALSQHPSPKEMSCALSVDFPESHVLPVPPRQWPRITNRTAMALVKPHDYYLEVARDSIANAPRSNALPIASLVVKKTADGLVVENRDGSLSFDLIEFLGEILSGAAVEMMKMISPRDHVPRITIDRLVVTRESWSFSAGQMQFVNYEEDHQRFLEVRRWMRAHNLPRFVFVRVPVEVKPFYLDFDSPVYVEIFCKMVRRMLASHRLNEPIIVTEMLPGPDQLWLRDSQGNTYTSELRIVAKDLRPMEGINEHSTKRPAVAVEI